MSALESWLAEVEARTVAAQPDADTPWGRWAAEPSGPHDRGEWWVLADDGDALAMVDGHLAFGIDPEALAAFYAGAHADVPKLCTELRAALGREAKLREALGGLFAACDHVLGFKWREETLNVGAQGDEVNAAWDACAAALEETK